MYLVEKDGFYLFNCNPHADLWTQQKAIALRMSRTIALQCVEFVGGEVVEVAAACLVR